MNLQKYATIIFDCDGVVLHSNRIKTKAFYDAALPYGETAAQTLMEYHVKRGGISRYKKFEYFLDNLVEIELPGMGLTELLQRYAHAVHNGLLECEVAQGLAELRKQTEQSKWLIVSGGDQAELRKLFSERKINFFFDGGIFGSPDTKDEILARGIQSGNIQLPAVFLGDSKYDYQAAYNAGLDFIFVSAWTEVEDWQDWCLQKEIKNAVSIRDLLIDNG